MDDIVALVSAPWASLRYPSIQLGILKAVLDRAAIPCTTYSLAVDWMEFLNAETSDADGPSLSEYEQVGTSVRGWGLADWAFALPPVRMPSRIRDSELVATAIRRGAPEELIQKVRAARDLALPFLNRCVDRVLDRNPLLVGFSTTYCQNHASLLLAHLIKQQSPETCIVFGGANCEGPMGLALHRLFPWVDIVVRGAGEEALTDIANALRAGRSIQPTSAVCVRGPSGETLSGDHVDLASLQIDDVPIPDYDEYFRSIEGASFYEDLIDDIEIPFESARGCWWGAKHHCTFCGLNGQTMAFRSKSPERLLAELRTLSERYRRRRFAATDNIMDVRYFQTVLPQLRQQGYDFELFYEIKGNLTKPQVQLLRESGVQRIQPGLESLSTPILQLMRKGITALQNIRLLKWCEELGVGVTWNILYGFPGESPDEYSRMADVASSLFHLQPPALALLSLERFSPYHSRPTDFGIHITGADTFYRYLYDVGDADLMDLAYSFEYKHMDGRDPDSYVVPLLEAISTWRLEHERKRTLRYFVGPDHVEIVDNRGEAGSTRYTLNDSEAAIYLACDAGATLQSLLLKPDLASRGLSEADILSFLHDCLDQRIMYHEDGKWLSLAVGTGRRTQVATEVSDASSRTRAPIIGLIRA